MLNPPFNTIFLGVKRVSSGAFLMYMEQHLQDLVFRLFIFATSSSVNVPGSSGCFLFLVFLAGGFGCEEGALSFPCIPGDPQTKGDKIRSQNLR